VPVCLVEVSLGIAHLEEVSILATSAWVVPAFALLLAWLQWLLDVPEGMVWDSGKDLGLEGLAETEPVSVFEIFHVVVLLALLEDSKLLVKHCVELCQLCFIPLLAEFLDHELAPGILVFWVKV